MVFGKGDQGGPSWAQAMNLRKLIPWNFQIYCDESGSEMDVFWALIYLISSAAASSDWSCKGAMHYAGKKCLLSNWCCWGMYQLEARILPGLFRRWETMVRTKSQMRTRTARCRCLQTPSLNWSGSETWTWISRHWPAVLERSGLTFTALRNRVFSCIVLWLVTWRFPSCLSLVYTQRDDVCIIVLPFENTLSYAV